MGGGANAPVFYAEKPFLGDLPKRLPRKALDVGPLDGRATGRAAAFAHVLVLVALWEDEQQALSHGHGLSTSRTGKDCCFDSVEGSLPGAHDFLLCQNKANHRRPTRARSAASRRRSPVGQGRIVSALRRA